MDVKEVSGTAWARFILLCIAMLISNGFASSKTLSMSKCKKYDLTWLWVAAFYTCIELPGFRFYVCNVPRMLMAISHVAKSLLKERQKLKVLVLSDVSELLEERPQHLSDICPTFHDADMYRTCCLCSYFLLSFVNFTCSFLCLHMSSFFFLAFAYLSSLYLLTSTL